MKGVRVPPVASGLLVTVIHLQTGKLELRGFRFVGLSRSKMP